MSIDYKLNPVISEAELDALFADAWPGHGSSARFSDVLSRSLGFVGAYSSGQLVGFVYVAWDGGSHAFLLDPTVRTDMRRQGIGTELVRRATDFAKSMDVEWLHVDYEPHLEPFYSACGFNPTSAGLIKLNG
jgi:predicted N-acetyltransferase YhbS